MILEDPMQALGISAIPEWTQSLEDYTEDTNIAAPVVYLHQEDMSFNSKEEVELRKLLEPSKSRTQRAKKFVLEWYGPTAGILGVLAALITGLYFFVKPDVSELRTSIENIHKDINRVDADIKTTNVRIDAVVNQANSRIDSVLSQALDKVLGAATKTLPPGRRQDKGTPQDDAALRNDLGKIRAVLVLATESDARLGRERTMAIGAELKRIADSQPELSSVAWDTMASLLRYSSVTATVPAIRWLGPIKEPSPHGFPGLLGLVEMKGVERYGSETRLPLRSGSCLLPLRTEDDVYRRLEKSGINQSPEIVMVVGSADSTIVLDKLHIRNVILKHVRVVYGGEKTVLENVSFVDCTFELVRSQRTTELTNLLLTEQSVNFGL
jgi:hypothetical protein